MGLLIKDETSEPQRLKLERVTKSNDLDIHSETFQIKGFKFNSWAIHQEQEPITNNEKNRVSARCCVCQVYITAQTIIALSSWFPEDLILFFPWQRIQYCITKRLYQWTGTLQVKHL